MDCSQLGQEPLAYEHLSTVQPSLRAVTRLHVLMHFLSCFSNEAVSTLKTGTLSLLPKHIVLKIYLI